LTPTSNLLLSNNTATQTKRFGGIIRSLVLLDGKRDRHFQRGWWSHSILNQSGATELFGWD
jgi:hypothetical protein